MLSAPAYNPWVRKIPWRRKWHPTPVFLPGESYGQRSLAGYSPWGQKESETVEGPTVSLSYCTPATYNIVHPLYFIKDDY